LATRLRLVHGEPVARQLEDDVQLYGVRRAGPGHDDLLGDPPGTERAHTLDPRLGVSTGAVELARELDEVQTGVVLADGDRLEGFAPHRELGRGEHAHVGVKDPEHAPGAELAVGSAPRLRRRAQLHEEPVEEWLAVHTGSL